MIKNMLKALLFIGASGVVMAFGFFCLVSGAYTLCILSFIVSFLMNQTGAEALEALPHNWELDRPVPSTATQGVDP